MQNHKKIYMVNTGAFPTNGTHQFMIRKFIQGFTEFGFEVNEPDSFDDAEDSPNNIFVMSDHFYGDIGGYQYMDGYSGMLEDLGDEFSESLWIFWAYHNIMQNEHLQGSLPFKKYLLTGEHYRKPNFENKEMFGENFVKYINNPKYVSLPFSSSLKPSEIDNVLEKRTDKFDCGYCGCEYKPEWIARLRENYSCFVHFWNANNFLSEEERIDNAFLGSKICLAFNSDANANNGLPSERVFEGLSYGCVVLTDAEIAVEATDGAAIYVKNYEELEKNVSLYLTNEQARQEKQKQGLAFAKTKGTYVHVAERFLEAAQKLYH